MRQRRSSNQSIRSLLQRVITLALAGACSRGGDARQGDTTAVVNVAETPRPAADSAPTITVYKSPTCGCCNAWVDHLRENGFRVAATNTNALDSIKRRHGVEAGHASCHTAIVGSYVVEGHVPAADIRRLLAERPAVTGLAVPGMPAGSPGMEGPYKESYEVLAFTRGGRTTVFAKH